MIRPIFTIDRIRLCAYKLDAKTYRVSANGLTRIRNEGIKSGPCELASEELNRQRKNKPKPYKLSHYLYVGENKAIIVSLKQGGDIISDEVELRRHCGKTDEELKAEIKLKKKLASEAYYIRRRNVKIRRILKTAVIIEKPKFSLFDKYKKPRY